MKITRSQLRRIIREQLKEDYDLKVPTVGSILDAIEIVQGVETEEREEAVLKKLGKDLGWKVLKMIAGPAGDALSIGKDVFGRRRVFL